ncbi:uncharacterized protein LOC121397091 isoform X2 [Xenopus laevis]|uniref:Uncharacterized protein LOC121397091 isoform X2 n=1 Tax=Xenopus laevis TaxID=8355 RepID=A0A8J1LHG3_XENLA|nr:uncharacterized protein LOC121397091 isoform X2 [Xenopus laevis]
MENQSGTQHGAGTHHGTSVYTEAEVTRILSHFSGPAEFLQVPTVTNTRRQLETLRKRTVDLELHGLTLAEYHKKAWIPRGLRENVMYRGLEVKTPTTLIKKGLRERIFWQNPQRKAKETMETRRC